MDDEDVESKLELGDTLVRIGQYDEAIRKYMEVAEWFAQQGHDIKCVAACKQVAEIARKQGLESTTAGDALRLLANSFRNLGLAADAEDVETQLAELSRPRPNRSLH